MTSSSSQVHIIRDDTFLTLGDGDWSMSHFPTDGRLPNEQFQS
jgi:hypothetical protein